MLYAWWLKFKDSHPSCLLSFCSRFQFINESPGCWVLLWDPSSVSANPSPSDIHSSLLLTEWPPTLLCSTGVEFDFSWRQAGIKSSLLWLMGVFCPLYRNKTKQKKEPFGLVYWWPGTRLFSQTFRDNYTINLLECFHLSKRQDICYPVCICWPHWCPAFVHCEELVFCSVVVSVNDEIPHMYL